LSLLSASAGAIPPARVAEAAVAISSSFRCSFIAFSLSYLTKSGRSLSYMLLIERFGQHVSSMGIVQKARMKASMIALSQIPIRSGGVIYFKKILVIIYLKSVDLYFVYCCIMLR
jgi:hypothetical protein